MKPSSTSSIADRKLAALEDAARKLGTFPKRKRHHLFLQSGVTKTGVENHPQIKATTNAATRANVLI